ncbi:hypothetical protein AB9T89_18705 [Flavobacterium oncorhynchi]|uniref:hypothetical protein n=1 Tax=Flavobacterium oncorhynchi TaxID=728056 RepID=UPI00351A2235
MKRSILVIIVFVSQINFAQNIFPATGNVGIGITLPSEKLHVFGNIRFAVNQSANDADYYGFLESFHASNTGVLSFVGAGGAGKVIGGETYGLDTVIYSDKTEKIRILGNGNVGIGTSNPLFKLDVNGVVNINSATDGGGLRFNSAANSQIDSRNWIVSSDGYEYGDLVFKSSSTFSGVPSDVKLTIKSNGNVGIGVKIPTNKLDVNGIIHSKEVKVDMNGWSDFVFKKEYNLPTLDEVEKHIVEKGHLENIPSEKEVLRDGINLGEMNTKLLQKIEELTLYVIQQNKTIEELKQEIKNIKSKI